jgi:hypothetical protein
MPRRDSREGDAAAILGYFSGRGVVGRCTHCRDGAAMIPTDAKSALSLKESRTVLPTPEEILPVIKLKLMATGVLPKATRNGAAVAGEAAFEAHTADLIRKIQQKFRGFPQPLCPPDARIQAWLDRTLGDVKLPGPLALPSRTLHMDFHGLARTLSLPAEGDTFKTPLLSSYRLLNGVLHNPATEKRTTKGTFHVADTGFPVPADKKAVPREAFARLLYEATRPPADLLELPFTSGMKGSASARVFASLFLRPIISPEVPGIRPRRDMEIRFFAPGSLVCNLDFVESIFGNAGDPYLPENDPGLDPEHFCGVTGCVILAPHLVRLRKKDLGLPHVSAATDLQKKQGMCWSNPDELYNDGKAFKATLRTPDGLILTLIADNYFGYCKKEVKTQIGFACNLTGASEEEHAGGALVFPSYSLGDFTTREAAYIRKQGWSFREVKRLMGDAMEVKPEGYGIDRKEPRIVYLPEDAGIRLADQIIHWTKDGKERTLKLLADHVYIFPSGYKVHLEKHPDAPSWRLIGTVAEGLLCHKPSTVSGGGKSEISKAVGDAILFRNAYIQDFDKDFKAAEKIIGRDYGDRFRDPARRKGNRRDTRPFLSPERSLGSVIRLLTPSPEYTPEYNRWVKTIPPHVRSLVFLIKRFHRPEWGEDFRSHFSVDVMDGRPGHELNYHHRRLVSGYLRVGTDADGNWRVFRLRTDFVPAVKLQQEDDITASVVLPPSDARSRSAKYVGNCEYRLFQRPDDAAVPGLDRQAEKDLAQSTAFISNFEPLGPPDARAIRENVVEFGAFTEPMRRLIDKAAAMGDGWFVCSARPRLTDGKPTPNVRYLQDRPDLVDPFSTYVAEQGMRLRRKIPAGAPVATPVGAVLMGRRNNPPDRELGIRPLAVYNPLHYQELPEAFMDFIASLTGKSPSTTGAGTEGALTKAPFNALPATADLNAALVSYILTDLQVFSTSAGHVGSKYRVDHDLSLLFPELWCRLTAEERDANRLIANGELSRVNDFKHRGRTVPAGRLGYRINSRFLHAYVGRVFSDPLAVFPLDMLEPERQSLPDFVDGVENIAEAQRATALSYFEDGTAELACPPLLGLLHIMAHGSWKGLTLQSPAFRRLFTREEMLQSEWYRQRIALQQEKDRALYARHRDYLKGFIEGPENREAVNRLGLRSRLEAVEVRLRAAERSGYAASLQGMIGADPLAPV